MAADFGGTSLWFNIPGDKNTSGNEVAGGWVLFNQLKPAGAFGWNKVTDSNANDTIVEFALTAGTHTLEIARRSDGAYLDAIAITNY